MNVAVEAARWRVRCSEAIMSQWAPPRQTVDTWCSRWSVLVRGHVSHHNLWLLPSDFLYVSFKMPTSVWLFLKCDFYFIWHVKSEDRRHDLQDNDASWNTLKTVKLHLVTPRNLNPLETYFTLGPQSPQYLWCSHHQDPTSESSSEETDPNLAMLKEVIKKNPHF